MVMVVMELHRRCHCRRDATMVVMCRARQQVTHGERRRLRLLLLLMLLLLQLRKLLRYLGPIRADLPVVTELAALSEVALAQVALERFFARVRIFVLLSVLLKAERFSAKAALEILLGVVLFVVPLQAEFSLEGGRATVDIALEDSQTLLTVRPANFGLQRAI